MSPTLILNAVDAYTQADNKDDKATSPLGPLLAMLLIFTASLFGEHTPVLAWSQALTTSGPHSCLFSVAVQAHLLSSHTAHSFLHRKTLWHRYVLRLTFAVTCGAEAGGRNAGVILSTAFVHLLQDAFESLLDPRVKRYTKLHEWVGLIMCVIVLSYDTPEILTHAHVVSAPCFPSSL
jgi:hypothetical protein